LVDRIDVALERGADRRVVRARLAGMLGDNAAVQLPGEAGQRLRVLSDPLADGMRLSGLLAMMVAVFIIYNAAGVSVAQRRREIGVLRALGVERRDVILHFCLESLVLACFGIALGLLLSQQLVLLAYAQTRMAFDQVLGTPPPPPRILLEHVLRGSALGLCVAVVAALVPARRAARLDPVAALRPSVHITAVRSMRVGRLALAGVALMLCAVPAAALGNMFAGYIATFANLIGAALIMPALVLGMRRAVLPLLVRTLGACGRLGVDQVERDLGRTTMNVMSLMVAVVLSIGFSSFLYSFEQSVRGWFEQVSAADMVVTAGSPFSDGRRMPLGAGALERLSGIAGLERAQVMRLVDQRYEGHTLHLIASDTRSYLFEAHERGKPWRVLDGRSPIGERELFDAPQIVLSENAALHLQLKAGDHMRFDTPSGRVEFTVRAVVVDYSSELGTGFIDRRYYQTPWQDSAVDQVNLYLAAGVDQAKVAQAIRARLGGGKALFVTDTVALRDDLMRNAERAFAYARSLELIMLLIAIMGVMGTLVASVLDRTREIGIQRALGATRRQIVQAMMIEAAFLGVCAVVGGVLAGSLHSALLLHTVVARNSGWLIPFAFPWAGALRMTLMTIGIAALSGFVPGLRAARLDAKTALASE
jgi:putative ABC transport system permease protein